MTRNDQPEQTDKSPQLEEHPADKRSRLFGLLPQVSPERRHEILGSLFFTGPALRPYLIRFNILLALSVTIATFGIVADSVAVVIGAMLIAPLMTPVLGIAAGNITGSTRRLTITYVHVLVASVGAIFLAWLLAEIIPDDQFALVLPAELLARTEPTPFDMGIALAAGAAGAFVLVQKEALAAAPGTAIAVALVPPLAVVGISLSIGEYSDALGALILYLTNLAGIVLAAMVVFALMGFIPENLFRTKGKQIRLGFIAALIAVVIVYIPLALNSRVLVSQAQGRAETSSAIQEWLGEDTDTEVFGFDEDQNEITVNLAGQDEPPPVDGLAKLLDTDKEVRVRWAEISLFTAQAPAE
jgi:uncharacterized hydrophobic protein (TIGR00271 family)